MHKLKQSAQAIAVASCGLAFSNLAQAQPPGASVTFSPAVTAVPALDSSLLIALGVLLALVAVYTLRRRGTAQKIVSVLLLGGGLLMGGVGIERSMAEPVPYHILSDVTIDKSNCAGGSADYDPFNAGTLTNLCEHGMTISGYTAPCPLTNPVCPEGSTVEGNGGSCPLPSCIED